jgi:hypothetical protein
MRDGGVWIVGERLEPDLDLALLTDPVDPQGHIAEGKRDRCRRLPRDRQPDTITIEGDRLYPAMQRDLDRDVLAGTHHHPISF